MKFDTEYIEKLADLLNQKGLTEVSLNEGNQSITIKKEGIINAAIPAVVAESIPATTSTKNESHKGKPITSPMVGTFYLSSSPDAEPLVEVGKTITKGQVVCIVEAMKLMNEIESEHTGTVCEICVENGQPVEFGQVLMYVE